MPIDGGSEPGTLRDINGLVVPHHVKFQRASEAPDQEYVCVALTQGAAVAVSG